MERETQFHAKAAAIMIAHLDCTESGGVTWAALIGVSSLMLMSTCKHKILLFVHIHLLHLIHNWPQAHS